MVVTPQTSHPGDVSLDAPLPVRWETALFIAVVGVAIFYRFFHFLQFPPGLWYDEAVNGMDAISISDHDHLTVWRTSNFGHSTVYFYLLIVSFKLFGYTVFAFRLVPALAGLGAVVAFYFLARWLLGAVSALITTALFAMGRFPVTFSRISWEVSLQPLLEIMAVYFLFRALETGRKLFFLIAGGSLAAGLYTYLGFRFVLVVMLFFILYIAVAERRLLIRNVPGLVLYAASFAVVVLPLGQYAVQHPNDVLARTRAINVFKEMDSKESYSPLWHNLRVSAEMMNVQGDADGRHNLPGAPTLDEISGALLVLGLVVCLTSIRNWRKASMAGWLVLALVPGALTISIENPSGIRAVGAIPPLFMIIGLAIASLHRSLAALPAGRALFGALAAVLLVGSGALNYHQFFDDQAHSQAVYDAFVPVFTDIAKFAERDGDAYVAKPFIDHPAVKALTHGKPIHRYDAASTLPFRPGDRDVLVALGTRQAAIIPTLQRLYPHLIRHDDVDPYGRTMFIDVTIPSSDLVDARRLAVAIYAGTDLTSPPLLADRTPPQHVWSSSDMARGPFTAVWDGFLFVPSSPADTVLSLASPGSVAIEVDGARVASGENTSASSSLRLTYGEHRVRLVAFVARPGTTSARIAMGGVDADAGDVLYASSLGTAGFTALLSPASDVAQPPASTAHVPFALGVTPPGSGSVEYRGTFTASTAGSYGFALESAQPIQLFIDDGLVVSNEGGDPRVPPRVEGRAGLSAGDHTLSLKYSGAGQPDWALYLSAPEGGWRQADGSEFTPTEATSSVTLSPDPSWPTEGRAAEGISKVAGLGLLSDDTLVAAGADRLVFISPDGRQSVASVALTGIVDLNVAPDGRIVGLDRDTHSLVVLTEDGAVVRRFEGGFGSAAALAVAGDLAYVASPGDGVIYRVSLASGEVAPLLLSTRTPNIRAVRASGIAVAPGGALYVADADRRVLVISSDGASGRAVDGVGSTPAQSPRIAVYGKLVLVTDPSEDRIVIYDLTGKRRGVYQFTSAMSDPTAIAIDAAGNVYVADVTAHVFKLRINVPLNEGVAGQ